MADRYLLESGAPDGYLLEDGSGVLLLEGTGFDPATDFPWPQPVEVPLPGRRNHAALAMAMCAWSTFTPATVPVGWNPDFPDLVPGRRHQTYVAPQPVFAINRWGLDALPWLPTFPDFARGAQPRPRGGTEYVPALNRWGLDALPWLPNFPDFARTHLPRPRGGEEYVPALNQWGLDATPWLPVFPDFARTQPPRLPGWVAYTPALERWGLDAVPWFPVFPDSTRETSRAPASDITAPVFVGQAPVSLDWLPAFPDQLRSPRQAAAWAHAYVPALSRWGLDTLPWLPSFPDFARAYPPRQTAGSHFAAPLLITAPNQLDWLPTLPNWFAPVGTRVNLSGSTLVSRDVLVPFDWNTQTAHVWGAQGRVLGDLVRLTEVVAPPSFAPLDWLPVSPPFLTAPRLVRTQGGAWVWVFEGVLPFTFGGAASASVDARTRAETSGTPSTAHDDDSPSSADVGGDTPTKAQT